MEYTVEKIEDCWLLNVENRWQLIESEALLISICASLNSNGYKATNNWTELL